MQLFQFLGAGIGAAVVVSFASLLWPKFTAQPRPPALTKVREMVVQTSVGKQAADVLGVSDDATPGPVNVGSFITSEGNAIVSNVGKAAQNAVTSKVIEQLASQFDKLPDDQKTQFQTLICSPSATKQ
jgi:hypothetical protein